MTKISDKIYEIIGTNGFFDECGYPTEEVLKFIENYEITGYRDFRELMTNFIPNCWNVNYGRYKVSRLYRKHQKVEYHTGGWSGNEEVISAILSNHKVLRMLFYCIRKIDVGGHFYFCFHYYY